MRSHQVRLILWGLTMALLHGCSGPDDPAWRINKTRVLAAKVMVDAEPERASIRPGEAFHVDWLVVNPDGPVDVSYKLSVCKQAELTRDVDCEGPTFVEVSGNGKVPTIAATAPGAQDLAGITHLLIRGTIDQRDVVMSAPLELSGAEQNHNPAIAPDPLHFGSDLWTAEDGPCAPPMPEILADDATHEISFVVSAADREPGETLQLSHFTTAGELDRQFSIAEPEAPPGDVELKVTWIAKRGHATPEGKVVRFFFVLRDSRGGTSSTTRALCMRPAP
jgi:hypothetical protein